MDMLEGDPTNPKPDPRKGRWKRKEYSKEIIEYANKDIAEKEKEVYMNLYEDITEYNNLDRPEDLMMLDNALFDYLRIKRLQKILLEEGDIVSFKLKSGKVIRKAHEASFLLNAVETQFRNTMKELLLTRKEIVKKKIGMDSQDFASFLSGEVIEVDDDG